MGIKSYRDLKVWERAIDLVVRSYQLTRRLPRDELYGLVSQIRRAAASVPANVAEGPGRDHLGDYLHHLSVANGSLMELETHLLVAERLSYLKMSDVEPLLALAGEVGRMLAGLTRKLKTVASPSELLSGPDTRHLKPDTRLYPGGQWSTRPPSRWTCKWYTD